MTRTLGDRYTLDAEIGAGGMATVHRARDLRHERPVAIKMLRPDVAQSVGTERSFARFDSRLDCPIRAFSHSSTPARPRARMG
jgi:serine/threonine-protein kinase